MVAFVAVLTLAGLWSVHAMAVTLVWDPSPSTAVTHYRLHVGYASGVYDYSLEAGPGRQCALPPLAAGRAHYFAVTAHDVSGGRSGFSNEVALAGQSADAMPLAAGFTAWPVIGVAPLAVRFTPFAVGALSAYRWNLGDGAEVVADAAMPLPDVVHTYTRAGTYTVTFTIAGPAGEHARRRVAAVRVLDAEGSGGLGAVGEPRLEVVERSCAPPGAR